MKLLRRNKESETIKEIPSINLASPDGEVWMEFPVDVIHAARQANVRIMRTNPFPKRLSITSAVRGEGVTYLSRAMGTVLAVDLGQSVCVVEMNWWWPADYPEALANRPGLAEVMLGKAEIEKVIMPTAIENLALIPAGKLARGQMSSYARSEELEETLLTLSEQFDHVILDLPSVTGISEAIPLASLGDALCLVIRQGVTSVQRVKMTLDDLDHLNIIGVIMNQVNISTPSFILNYIAQD